MEDYCFKFTITLSSKQHCVLSRKRFPPVMPSNDVLALGIGTTDGHQQGQQEEPAHPPEQENELMTWYLDTIRRKMAWYSYWDYETEILETACNKILFSITHLITTKQLIKSTRNLNKTHKAWRNNCKFGISLIFRNSNLWTGLAVVIKELWNMNRKKEIPVDIYWKFLKFRLFTFLRARFWINKRT